MITRVSEKGDGKEFVSHAPGFWPNTAPEIWNDWKWQLKNRVTSLAQLEQHLDLSDEERSGVLLSGDKLRGSLSLSRVTHRSARRAFERWRCSDFQRR